MSEVALFVIPQDPFFVPGGPAQAAAEALARRLAPAAEAIAVSVTAKPQFFDAGENFRSLRCPEGGKRLDMEWWAELMEEDFDGEGYSLAAWPSPCGRPVTLAELVYDAPQGFARFAVALANPGVDFDDAALAAFAEVIGAPVLLVRQEL